MVLVTRGCHLLDNLVVVSCEAHVKVVRGSREGFCEGCCAHPTRNVKSNSRARCEECQVVLPDQSARVV
jgi:hypothetical protein